MKVIDIPSKKVEGWALPEMPGEAGTRRIYVISLLWYIALVKDLVISMDDRYMYITCWGHGDVRQYDIADTANPKLVGQVSSH